MGNVISGIKYYLGYDTRLEQEVTLLKERLDKNMDNKVTKEELKSYFDILADRIDKNSDGMISEEELELYNNRYEKLQEEHEKLLDQIRSNKKIELKSNISQQALKEYIDTEIIHSDANLKLIPDPIERKMYLGIYNTAMESLEKLFNTTTIDLLNHRITFHIQPKNE